MILAVPHDKVTALLPERLRAHEFFSPLAGWEHWPILNAAFLVEGDLPAFDMRCYPLHTCQWIFRRAAPGHGTWFIASMSAAFHELDHGAESLLDTLQQEFNSLIPGFASARLKRRMLLPQMKATFAAHPGVAARRLPSRTPFPGLALAGAWTATDWPDTQESALRSGLAAARTLQSPG